MFPAAADTFMIDWLRATVFRIQSCCCSKCAQSFVCKHMRTTTYVESSSKLLQYTTTTIIIIIIVIHVSYFTTVQLILKRVQVSLTKHLLLCPARRFLTIRHVLSATAFCVRICRAGRRLSSFKLSCRLCWDNTCCG